MDRLKQLVEKELNTISEQGVSSSNLPVIGEMVDIIKDIAEIENYKRGEYGMRYYPKDYGRSYERGGYNNEYGRDNYNDDYGRMYSRGDNYGHRGMERGMERFCEKVDRMMDCLEEWFEGKNRYHDGAHQGHMVDGMEKTMYAVCNLVESLMDSAETPEEKETIRKHIEKLKSI